MLVKILATVMVLATGTAVVVALRGQAANPVDALIDVLRRTRWARRALTGLSVICALGALGFLTYPFWTDVYSDRLQVRLEKQLASPEIRQDFRADRVENGDSLTRLKIPAIGVDVVVVEGTTQSALRAGAGHYPETPLPCAEGNVSIAGHRTTYGRPFNQLDELKPGDVIILETPVGDCTYEVSVDPFIVAPSATDVVANTADPRLTLTTCHPEGSARQRLIVQAARVTSGIEGA